MKRTPVSPLKAIITIILVILMVAGLAVAGYIGYHMLDESEIDLSQYTSLAPDIVMYVSLGVSLVCLAIVFALNGRNLKNCLWGLCFLVAGCGISYLGYIELTNSIALNGSEAKECEAQVIGSEKVRTRRGTKTVSVFAYVDASTGEMHKVSNTGFYFGETGMRAKAPCLYIPGKDISSLNSFGPLWGSTILWCGFGLLALFGGFSATKDWLRGGANEDSAEEEETQEGQQDEEQAEEQAEEAASEPKKD